VSDALIYVHITAGTAAILAGFTALFARKGESLHRASGNAFFVSMLVMCTSAFFVAVERAQTINIYASLLTLYFIGTSWTAATRRDGESGRFEAIALVAAIAIATSASLVAGGVSKQWAPLFYGVGGLAALAAFLDVTVIARGGLKGAQRIARHLWRMTFAMFVATGSFFFGQSKFIPAEVKEIYLNAVPPVLVLVLLAYWVVRVLLTRWYRADAVAASGVEEAAFAKAD
jgi:uncharacterized membrane protein